ncbi:uncharacterized protein LOC129906704 [Episyrphus balteatus]|uniref:uncharacterized protein LOC129906704 n=1 Tax=Episyrphus balteatus TaxID=286459 RepID=UPI0024862554|nr:uncharacterized protein LOC129906704 [Episyrphus balteatus]
MPTEFSMDDVNDYFTKLNPIAMKISFDIDETKSAYEHIWAKLNTSEHNEIINETLMKPEISLRYFDNFSITTTASSLSLSSMVTPSQNEEPTKRPSSQPCHNHSLDTRRFYDFDGRNLSTYSDQKVGLKLVHDDTLGTFRDGHSMPFSYKTKSQINLKLFLDEGSCLMRSSQIKPSGISEVLQKPLPSKSDEPKSLPPVDNEVLQISAEALKKLQTELTTNLLNRNKSENASAAENTSNIVQGLKSFDNIDAKYQRFYDDTKDGGVGNQSTTPNHTELNLRKLISKNGKSIATKFHHSKYGYNDTTDDDDEFERVNLMMNCCSLSAGGMTTSSSSAPSEDDEKTLCEDLKGLLENDGLRKGFDFLNNW